MGNRWGNSGNSVRLYFWGAPKSLQVVIAAMKLKDASQVVLVIKNLLANAGDVRDTGSIPELGRSPGEGHSKPLQYSCLENRMDRGAW